MADYGADPGGYKSASYGMHNDDLIRRAAVTTKEKQLEARLKELEEEVRRLKGYKKWDVVVTTNLFYTCEAQTEEEAINWYHSTGRAMTAENRDIIEVKATEQ